MAAPIDHVIVVMLENRSFDHMLGFLVHPDERFDGLGRGGPFQNPGWGPGGAGGGVAHGQARAARRP